MAKITVGSKMPDFTFNTAYESGIKLSDAVSTTGKTALVFLRYYGCTLCQMDIHNYAKEHAKIAVTGGKMLVVLQSVPDTIHEQVKPGELPFDIICDPDQELYKLFEIGSMTERPDINDPAVVARFEAMKNSGFSHGKYEGNEQQLPACFVLSPDLTVTHAHYGSWVGDSPSTDELAALLS